MGSKRSMLTSLSPLVMTFRPLSDDEDDATTIPEYPATPSKGDAEFDDDADIEDPGKKDETDEEDIEEVQDEPEFADDADGFGSDEDDAK